MPILFRCQQCHALNQVPTATAGLLVDCAYCGDDLVVPQPDERYKATPPSAVECPGCANIIELPLEAAGRTIQCLRCQTFMIVPALTRRKPVGGGGWGPEAFELGIEGLQKGERIADPRPRADWSLEPRPLRWRDRRAQARTSVARSMREVGADPLASWVGWMILVVLGFPWIWYLAPRVLGPEGMRYLHWGYFAVGSAMAFGGACWAVATATGVRNADIGSLVRPLITSLVGLVIFLATDSLNVLTVRPPEASALGLPPAQGVEGSIGVRPTRTVAEVSPEGINAGRRSLEAALRTESVALSRRTAQVRTSLTETFGPEHWVSLLVDGVTDAEAFELIVERLRPRAGKGADDFYATMESADRMLVVMGPIADADAFAQDIGSGTTYVLERDPLRLALEWDRWRPKLAELSPPKSRATDELTGSETDRPSSSTNPGSVRPPPLASLPTVRAPAEAKSADAIFADANPEFVAIGDHTVREVWNLRSHDRLGSLFNVEAAPSETCLSSDGNWFATLNTGRGRLVGNATRGIRVWSTRAGEASLQLEFEVEPDDFLGFAGPSRLVLVTRKGLRVLAFDVPEGRKVIDARLPVQIDWASLRLGLDGRRLAMAETHGDRVSIFDLEAGTVLPATGLFGDSRPISYECLGLMFDTTRGGLAGIFTDGEKTWLGLWDGQDGAMLERKAMLTPDQGTLWKGFTSRPWVDELPGGDWLIRGAAIVRQDGRIVELPGGADEASMFLPRRAVPGGWLAVVDGFAAIAHEIRMEALPR